MKNVYVPQTPCLITRGYPLVCYIVRENCPVEIVAFSIENGGDFPVRYVSHYQRATNIQTLLAGIWTMYDIYPLVIKHGNGKWTIYIDEIP